MADNKSGEASASSFSVDTPAHVSNLMGDIERATNAIFDEMSVSDGVERSVAERYARAAINAVPSPHDHVGASIVPPHCTGYSFSFDPGTLHVRKDGSGYIVLNEDDLVLEDDRCEGPDGPEGSVYWITRMDASEMVALRDFLNGAPTPHDHLMGWEHISSAPRDGSEVLVWNGRSRHVAHYDKIESEWVSSYRTTTKRLPVAPKPTLWQPLPSPPATTEGSDNGR